MPAQRPRILKTEAFHSEIASKYFLPHNGRNNHYSIWKTPTGKSRDYRDVVVNKKLHLRNVFHAHSNAELVFSNSSGLNSVCEKLRFRSGFLVDGRPDRGIKRRFQNSPAKCERGFDWYCNDFEHTYQK